MKITKEGNERGRQRKDFLICVIFFLAVLFVPLNLFLSDRLNCVGVRGSEDPSFIEAKKESAFVTQKGRIAEWKIPEDLEAARNIECDGKKEALSNGAFCIGQARYAGADLGMVDGLVEIFDGGTVLDLGAGMGWYKEPLLSHPTHPVANYEGFDGALNVEEKSGGKVKHMDLTQPDAMDARSCSHVADWVMSLEVGEHIPKDKEDAYLRNIRCRALKGAIISWANPTQKGGLAHINLKKRDDAIETVERWGFKADLKASEKFVEVAKFSWFKLGNVVVYRLPQAEPSSPETK